MVQERIPWRSNGSDSPLSLLRAWPKKKKVQEKPILLGAKFEWVQSQRWCEACKNVDSAKSDRGETGGGGGGLQ